MQNSIFSSHFEQELKQLIRNCISETMLELQLQNPKQEDEFMTIEEAAEFLNLAKATIYAKTSERTIPFHKKGKKLYFKRAELQTWLSEGKQKTQSEIASEMSVFVQKKGGKHGK